MKFVTALVAALALLAPPAMAETAYELLFRGGALDDQQPGATLVYAEDAAYAPAPDWPENPVSELHLKLDPAGEQAALTMHDAQDRKRAAGVYPAGVGNPVIMYFMERVLRDVALHAGGSPFYLRNRLKSALLSPASVEEVALAREGASITAHRLRFTPFAGDPNAARMRGFDALEITAELSEDAPGGYLRLSADAPGYRHALTLNGEAAR